MDINLQQIKLYTPSFNEISFNEKNQISPKLVM